jgi:hypothetical protein
MKDIVLKASFGDDIKTVRLVAQSGGDNVYQIMIDNRYQGMLTKENNVWNAYLNKNTVLSGDDILILRNLLDEQDEH